MPKRGSNRYHNKFNNERVKHHKEKQFTPNYHKEGKEDKYEKFIALDKLSEHEVGITEYVDKDLPGFSGIIKARYSDFHVNEINTAGEIAKLTDMSVPEYFNFEEIRENDLKESPIPELIPQEKWDELLNLDSESTVDLDVTALSKEDRTKIHESVKNGLGQKIVAKTKSSIDSKLITFKKYIKGVNVDSRLRWPPNTGEFVHFLVYKECVDTIEASFKLGECLRIKSSMFTYAGVKDRRAKTTQWFCVKKTDPRKLIEKSKYLRNIHVGNVTFKDETLKLGCLAGNQFRIALRNVTADDALIDNALESLKTKGFINYYGLQRFGCDKEVPTHVIGLKLLQGHWKEACELILKPKQSDHPSSEITRAKRVFKETSNSTLAINEFSKCHDKCVESKLLLGLQKNHENDYVNALENIPRNMRLLYLHSFQSLVWNRIVSRRIKEFGLKPIAGDLVLLSEQVDEIRDLDDEADQTHESKSNYPDVKILTDSDLDSYNIYDIVLPLPGFDVKYPDNEVKNWYKDILEQFELTLEMPPKKIKTYNLSGGYRKILGQTKNLSWKTMKYNHPNDSLILSDLEELKGEPEPDDNPEGQYKALIMNLCLNSSCYATMVIREILKTDTSSASHAKLNKYHPETVKKEDVKVNFVEDSSLLADSAKYEAFKSLIFGETELKSKCESELEEPVIKKSKLVEDAEASIKIQPSLI